MKTNWVDEKETLKKLIEEGVPYTKIGEKYECTGANIKKQAKKLGIVLPSRRKINPNETFNKGKGKKYICLNCGKEFFDRESKNRKYCSHSCQKEHEYKVYINNWKNGEESGVSGLYGISDHIRKYLFEKYNCKCQKCGWGVENEYSHQIPLQIHHIDGDYKNNKEENLQLLCPNCHALTNTFGSLNRNGRKERKKYKRR